jgi:hypothetical protein
MFIARKTVGITTGYRLGYRGSIPGKDKTFSSILRHLDQSQWVPGAPFKGVKCPGREADTDR